MKEKMTHPSKKYTSLGVQRDFFVFFSRIFVYCLLRQMAGRMMKDSGIFGLKSHLRTQGDVWPENPSPTMDFFLLCFPYPTHGNV